MFGGLWRRWIGEVGRWARRARWKLRIRRRSPGREAGGEEERIFRVEPGEDGVMRKFRVPRGKREGEGEWKIRVDGGDIEVGVWRGEIEGRAWRWRVVKSWRVEAGVDGREREMEREGGREGSDGAGGDGRESDVGLRRQWEWE